MPMRKLLTVVFLFTIITKSYSQKVELPLRDSLIVYEETVLLDSTYSNNLLQKSIKTWFVNTFKDSREVIQSEDSANGRVIGKGQIPINAPLQIIQILGSNCNFTIQVDIKSGKYRCRIFNFFGEGTNILNIPINADYSQVYSKYLHDEYKGALFYPTQKLYSKFDDFFIQFDSKVQALLFSLKNAALNSKKDDF